MEGLNKLEEKVLNDYTTNLIHDCNHELERMFASLKKYNLNKEAIQILINNMCVQDQYLPISIIIALGKDGQQIQEQLKPVIENIAIKIFTEKVSKLGQNG